ncbi:hypothetical protein CC1G_07771 [Coprinopsis cinerea okayama7|uniref:F-box domain-containing protein n=1 Tax=Coprinopsis cinerea (strain Okayama-7 / 130 / ATCC MYA-4618 / FGSC 9003) TaxID=240176 RepID=A8NNZ2_COPC7|nr:hypothetical protein CC1G_07771 [Coprinopsis cinerea okayama7\|eukprot:XP_001835228.2 hypothetical protein CC1G_07771 [Coprinopsis cinerea okayama7\
MHYSPSTSHPGTMGSQTTTYWIVNGQRIGGSTLEDTNFCFECKKFHNEDSPLLMIPKETCDEIMSYLDIKTLIKLKEVFHHGALWVERCFEGKVKRELAAHGIVDNKAFSDALQEHSGVVFGRVPTRVFLPSTLPSRLLEIAVASGEGGGMQAHMEETQGWETTNKYRGVPRPVGYILGYPHFEERMAQSFVLTKGDVTAVIVEVNENSVPLEVINRLPTGALMNFLSARRIVSLHPLQTINNIALSTLPGDFTRGAQYDQQVTDARILEEMQEAGVLVAEFSSHVFPNHRCAFHPCCPDTVRFWPGLGSFDCTIEREVDRTDGSIGSLIWRPRNSGYCQRPPSVTRRRHVYGFSTGLDPSQGK